jgi:protein-tyrosine phosphatase
VTVFSWITDGLAVGGRFASDAVEQLALEHRIRAVIDLRDEDRDDEHVLRHHGIAFLHLPTPDNVGVSRAMLDDGVEFANLHLDAGLRVLVHCEHGIGRSALLALCVLVDRGMEPLAALALAKDRRAVVSPSQAQYEAWAAWLQAHGHAVPHFDAFAAIAYRHLRDAGLR